MQNIRAEVIVRFKHNMNWMSTINIMIWELNCEKQTSFWSCDLFQTKHEKWFRVNLELIFCDVNCNAKFIKQFPFLFSWIYICERSSSLEELEEKLMNSQFYVPRTRKSLVKGERFIRYVWKTWVIKSCSIKLHWINFYLLYYFRKPKRIWRHLVVKSV